MAARRGAARTFGVFAEGSHHSDLQDRDPFKLLWQELCAKVAMPPPPVVHVYGFSKGQITLLDKQIPASMEPLDILIKRMHERDGFGNAIIAFDAKPENELIPGGCMRHEVNFVLEKFGERAHLPEPFRGELPRLLAHYRDHPGQPRGPGRPAHGPLDVIYMDPMFEGIFVHDEVAVRRALGVKRTPKDWPSFNVRATEPARGILGKAIGFADDAVRKRVRGDMKSNKHGWALHLIRQMQPTDGWYAHAIVDRLKILLAA